MGKFKAGDILVCVDPIVEITKGKEYKCIYSDSKWTKVIGNCGKEQYFFNARFELKEKDMKFTKNDLKTGYHVVTRNGNVYVVLRDCYNGIASNRNILVNITNNDGFNTFENYDEHLLSNCSEYDILEVYEVKFIHNMFKCGAEKTLLWKRKEKSQSEVELDKLEQQIEEMKVQASKLRQSIEGENV